MKMKKKRTRREVGKYSKNKGGGFERKVAKKLREMWPDGEFERTPKSGGLQLKKGWKLGGDIATTSPTFPFCVECKDREGWNFKQFLSPACQIYKWWDQAVKDAKTTNKKPMLIFTRNYWPTFVAVRKEDWPFRLITDFIVSTPEFVCFEFSELERLYHRIIHRAVGGD